MHTRIHTVQRVKPGDLCYCEVTNQLGVFKFTIHVEEVSGDVIKGYDMGGTEHTVSVKDVKALSSFIDHE